MNAPAGVVGTATLRDGARARITPTPAANPLGWVAQTCSRLVREEEIGAEGGTPTPFVCDGAPDPLRIALFVDTPDHLSGVSRTLGRWQDEAAREGVSLRVHRSGTAAASPGHVVFPPVRVLRIPAYPSLVVHTPRLRDVTRYMQESEFNVVHLSTPGPMGLAGLFAARALNLPVVGTFHTHFPSYAGRLTGSEAAEKFTWACMRWFYTQLDRVAAPTESIRQELIDQGCRPGNVCVVGRGVDHALFHPGRRNEALRASWGGRGPFLLYVGRLSEEKNLQVLAESFRRLQATQADATLVLVGDGPARGALEQSLARLPVVFAGVRKGEDLARHYASADLFVFPSETDTLGNVVLEAQASGLPVIVSSKGGPKDCVQDGAGGLVLPAMSPGGLHRALEHLLRQPARRVAMAAAAHGHAARFTHAASFAAFRAMHETVLTTRAGHPA